MADYISQITLPDNNTYNLRDPWLKIYSGSCTTAAATAIKDVVCLGAFTLEIGAVIFVTFTNTNTAAVANLKLRVNNTTDETLAKPIKYEHNAAESNLPGKGYIRANQTYQFYYDGTNWVMNTDYHTYANDFASRLGHYNNILARKAITAESLIVGDNTGYEKVASGITFDLAYPIVWCTAAVEANASNYANMFLQHYDRNIATGAKSGFTSTANKVIYLVVTINGNIATIDSTIITDTLPSTEDGKIYISLGKLGAQSTGANYFFLYPTHPMFWYKNGAIRLYSGASEYAVQANNASTVNGLTVQTAVPANAIFTDHYAWTDITGKPTSIQLTGAVTSNATTLTNGAISIATTVNHGHGNITSDGKIGTAGKKKLVIIGTDNAITTGAEMDTTSTKVWLNKTGAWSAPTADDIGAATVEYVDSIIGANNAMVFKGTLDGAAASENSGAGGLTPGADCGDTYRVTTGGYINGEAVEIGDLLICLADSTGESTTGNYSTIKSKWAIVQGNVDGALFKGSNSLTSDQYLVADGTSGKVKSQALPTASTGTAGIIKIGTGSTNAAAGNHTHGNLTNDGKITATAQIANGDKLVIVDTDSTAASKITGSTITFDGSTETQVLSKKGTWVDMYTHPTGAGNNHIPSGGSSGQFLKYSSSGTAIWSALPTASTSDAGIIQIGTGESNAAAGNHAHGNLTNGGCVTTAITLAKDDYLIVGDNSASGKIGKGPVLIAAITNQTTSSKFLREDGSWAAPSYYTHPTGDGNKHVPANSTTNSGKFLKATGTAGTYEWSDLPTANTSTAGIIKIGSTANDAMAGNTTVTNVSYTAASDDNSYPILMKNSTGSTTTAAGVKFNTDVTINPSTSTITANEFIGNIKSNKIIPIMSKTFSSYRCSADNAAKGWLFFGKINITDTTWQIPWSIHYRLYVSTSEAIVQGWYDCHFSVHGSTVNYYNYNNFYSTSNRPIYNHVLMYPKNTYTSYGGYIGARVQSAYSPTSLDRIFKIEILEMQGCTITLNDEIKRYDETYIKTNNIAASTIWYITEYNGTALGLQESGDANTNDTSTTYERYSTSRVTCTTLWPRYSLAFTHPTDSSKVIPVNTTENTTADTKSTITSAEFNIFDKIYYKSDAPSTVLAANSLAGASVVWYAYCAIDLRYSFNLTTTSLTAHKDVYLVCNLVSPTTATIRGYDQTGSNASTLSNNLGPITQTLPSTEDGLIYIKLGKSYSAYQIALMADHPIYWYKNGAIQEYNNYAATSNITSKIIMAPVTGDTGIKGYLTYSPATTNDNALIDQDSLYVYNTMSNDAPTSVLLNIGKSTVRGGITLHSATNSEARGNLVPTTLTANTEQTWTLPNTTGWIAAGGNGSSTGVGNAYTPVYLNSSGILQTTSPVQYTTWTIPNGKKTLTLTASGVFTANTYVISLVVTSGEANLKAPLTWTTSANTLVISTTQNVTGAVSGYVLTAIGAAVTVTSSAS